MSNNLTKEQILGLAKEKGIKLSFLTNLINGYRGKMTDWKNGKTTLTDYEIKTITTYLNGDKQPASDDELKFALFNGAENITDEMYDEVKGFAEMVRLREEAKRKEKK